MELVEAKRAERRTYLLRRPLEWESESAIALPLVFSVSASILRSYVEMRFCCKDENAYGVLFVVGLLPITNANINFRCCHSPADLAFLIFFI